jgi:hypothetical protein
MVPPMRILKMSENETTRSSKRTHYPDRITMDSALLAKVDGWIAQVTARKKGVLIKRKDMVLWKLEQESAELSEAELQALSSQFYDEERFLRELLEEVRSAKARGEKPNLDGLTGAVSPIITKPRRKRAEKLGKEADSLLVVSIQIFRMAA